MRLLAWRACGWVTRPDGIFCRCGGRSGGAPGGDQSPKALSPRWPFRFCAFRRILCATWRRFPDCAAPAQSHALPSRLRPMPPPRPE
jgi:hypothetical protein